MAFDIQFLGGAETVTGSKYLIRCNDRKILVDCGLFQGVKTLREKNWSPFFVEPASIDAIILTHAHIDHSGYIPRLIKDGFRGKIYCTAATKELCQILLQDAGHLMEEEAEYLNRNKRTKHKPALPLYTAKEGLKAIEYFVSVEFEVNQTLDQNLSFEYRYAGHILGAASVILHVDGKKIAFTGDVGRLQDPIFYPPQNLPPIDYLVTESTYGNRRHETTDCFQELENQIHQTFQKKGVLLIPAFAVGRAQMLTYFLSVLLRQGRIPQFPMFLNSPMATDVGDIFFKHRDLHRLSKEECKHVADVVSYVHNVADSKALNEKKGPMLIISASGMLTGGRILHHLKAFAGDEKNTILLTGFQAAGTRGEALLRGARELKVFGEYIEVRAEIKVLHNVSAHADYYEILQWLAQSHIHPKKVFVTHGEPSAADELRRRLQEKFSWDCVVPTQDQIFNLE